MIILVTRIFIVFFLCAIGLIFKEDVFSKELSRIPKPKKASFSNMSIFVDAETKVIAAEELKKQFPDAFQSLENVLKELPSITKNSSTADESLKKQLPDVFQSFENVLKGLLSIKKNYSIIVKILSNEDKSLLKGDIASALLHREAYWIDISKESIKVIGTDSFGVLCGITTLEKILHERKGKVYQGSVLDWPDHRIRALHLVLRGTDPENIKQLMKIARYGHYNTLIVEMGDAVILSTNAHIARKDAWTKDVFLDVIQTARENGLTVIPELKLLTHQEKLLKNKYPHLMFNKSTYDPRKEEVYMTVLPMVDEIINLIRPKAFHIGHDEVAGSNEHSKKKWLLKEEEILPSELYLKDTERIHIYLKERGVETWMWGDMLVAAYEFPTILTKNLHGTQDYVSLRDKIPKDIVICDWHYFDGQTEFPSALSFVKAGHKVLGATWKFDKTIKNFSRYIANLPTGGEGMIATTWFHVQKKEWDTVNKIILTSSEAFWNVK